MEQISVIIESPKGSRGKFDFEPYTKDFKLNKILPAGMVFPFDFGFIPGTKGGDGDPLDVLVISEVGTFTGCRIDCRVIGAIKAKQTERNGDEMRNDRFIMVPDVSHLYADVTTLLQLPDAIVKELEAFFKNYNAQAGKVFEVIELVNAEEAFKMIKS